MTADQIRSLQPALAALLAIFRPCFKRTASFEHWERYIVGLITDLKRKSIEPIGKPLFAPGKDSDQYDNRQGRDQDDCNHRFGYFRNHHPFFLMLPACCRPVSPEVA